jgi:hypothetical protein
MSAIIAATLNPVGQPFLAVRLTGGQITPKLIA